MGKKLELVTIIPVGVLVGLWIKLLFVMRLLDKNGFIYVVNGLLLMKMMVKLFVQSNQVLKMDKVTLLSRFIIFLLLPEIAEVLVRMQMFLLLFMEKMENK